MCVYMWTLPRCLSGKESACQCMSCRRRRFDPWIRTSPWRGKWQPTLVFLPMGRGAWGVTVLGVTKS